MSIVEQTARFMQIGGQLEPEVSGWKNTDHSLRMRLLAEEIREYTDGELHEDPVETADGLCDIIVIAMGSLIAYFGLEKTRRLLAEVGASNLSKFERIAGQLKPVLREDGKILKGPDYYPPDIARILSSSIELGDAGKKEDGDEQV